MYKKKEDARNYAKNDYQDKKEYYRRKADIRKDNLYEEINALKTECRICGIDDKDVCTFHHPGEKTDCVSNMLNRRMALKKIKEEVYKCVVVCENCHRIIHSIDRIDANYRKLPKGKIKRVKEFDEFVKTQKCLICNMNDYRCIDFHHLNPKEKKYEISAMRANGLPLSSILKEIEKCIPLCANCHRKTHILARKYGIKDM